MKVLVLGGLGVLSLTLPISHARSSCCWPSSCISYRQTIQAYPSGGGSYIVASDNLGETAGLTAAGVAADRLRPDRLGLDRGRRRGADIAVAGAGCRTRCRSRSARSSLITLANLRGIRESGTIFAVPTYVFVLSMYRPDRLRPVSAGDRRPRSTTPPASALEPGTQRARPVLPDVGVRPGLHGDDRHRGDLERRAGLQAAGGEQRPHDAGLDGRAAGRRCSWASRTWRWQIGRAAGRATRRSSRSSAARSSAIGPLCFVLQVATALILVLAANTVVRRLPAPGLDPGPRPLPAAQLPVPRRPAGVHDRHRGAGGRSAIVLLVAFNGSLDQLIPLYAVGVFTSFTLSQAGMVVHWRRLRGPRLAARGRHQRPRRRRDRHRDARHREHQVLARRLDRGGADPAVHRDAAGDPRPLHARSTARAAPRRRSRPRKSQIRVVVPIGDLERAGPAGAGLRPGHRPGRPARRGGPRRRRPGEGGAPARAVGGLGVRRRAGRSSSRRTAR